MGKRLKTLIILLAVLIVLGGVLYYVLSREEPEIEIQEDVLEDIILFDYSYTDIDTLTIAPRDGEIITFVKDGVYWSVKDAEMDYELIHSDINTLAYSMAGLTAMNRLEETTPEDLAPYGLDNPTTVVTAKLINNTNLTVYIGSKTTRNSYYAMIEDDPAVYEINSAYGSLLAITLNDFRNKEIIQSIEDAMTIEYLLLLRENNQPIEMIVPEVSDDIVFRISSQALIQPFKSQRYVMDEQIATLQTALNAFSTAIDIIEDYPQDLSIYGLDMPQIEITIKDDIQDITLLIGDKVSDEETLVYCMIKDGRTVYTADASQVEYLKEVDAFSLIISFIMLANIEKVDQVIINGNDKEYTMEICRETVDRDDNGDGKNDIIDTYFVNDIEVAEDDFKDVYQLIIGISADAVVIEETDISDAVITIEYINNIEGAENDIAEFVPYNEFFYVAYVNGVGEFVVSIEEVDEVLSGLEGLIETIN